MKFLSYFTFVLVEVNKNINQHSCHATLVCQLQSQIDEGHQSSAKSNESILQESICYMEFIISIVYFIILCNKNVKLPRRRYHINKYTFILIA